jgi:hypothetical protein
MHTRPHKWFLILLALALAVAPLRGAWAISIPAATESTPPCHQMDMPAAGTPSDMQQQDNATETSHSCEQDCTGACCDAACNACVHAASALSDSVIFMPELHATPRDTMFRASFPKRTVIPPLRPPASL